MRVLGQQRIKLLQSCHCRATISISNTATSLCQNLQRLKLTVQKCLTPVCASRATAHEIAAALSYLHSQDLLHGDLTGGNILLASSDADERGFTAKVADFGLSRTLGSEPVDTGTYGTVTHMPPELLTTGQSASLPASLTRLRHFDYFCPSLSALVVISAPTQIPPPPTVCALTPAACFL